MSRPPIGRANQLRPIAGLLSASSVTIFVLAFVLDALTQFDVALAFRYLTISVAWLSVAAASFKLTACFVKPRIASNKIDDADLPTYTVIIPLFHEAHMVSGLIESLSQADYPDDKLDIVFACEAVDPETVAEARRLSKPPFRVIVVPPVEPGGEPQTKPRALNVVLKQSHGEIVTIYDAEDRPHPQQLRTAAAAFKAHPDWAALQAPLDYFNLSDGWLSRQFGLEYAALFHVLLPFYDRLGLPFPLGGTSNHIRRDVLESVGGWDAFNVTEDADLAFRIAADGHHIGWVSPPTKEEAVSRHKPWFKQRSRWLKGYLQSWLVHVKTPIRGGWRRAVMVQLTLGLSLLSVFFYMPVLLVLAINLIVWLTGWTDALVAPVYLGSLVFSLASGIIVGMVGAYRRKAPELLTSAWCMPVYWLLLFPPLMQALIELRTNPFHWHKTEHGVTRASH